MPNNIFTELQKYSNKEKEVFFPKFFKTGKGQYGEGDKFLGITTPNIRIVVKKYKDIPLTTISTLLKNPYHEVRTTAVAILVNRYGSVKTKEEKEEIYNFYLNNLSGVNNWDLVDISASKIVGDFLYNYKKDTSILFTFAKSTNMWKRRIAIISTFYYIKNKDCSLTLKISKLLLNDKQDLMHKAVGWMLREVGKNCGEDTLKKFLRENYKNIPRTTLRYAIERFKEDERKKYLKGDF